MAWRRRLSSLSSVVVLALALATWFGCAPAYEAPAPQGDGEYLVHVVHSSDETVGKIALWYTGSSKNIESIKAANPVIGTGPLRVGRRVRIPLGLVTRTDTPSVAPATPTPVRLEVITESSAATTTTEGKVRDVADLNELDKFDEEVGPAQGGSSDSMNLRGSPPFSEQSSAAEAAAAVRPSPEAVEPLQDKDVALAEASDVDRFESQVDQLLQREQAELDQLQRELSATQPEAQVTKAPQK